MEHIISVLVENRFGVLSHIAGMFAGRGFNIDSLAVSRTHDPSISRMTIVVEANDTGVDQIVKQLNRQVDVIRVDDLSSQKHVERELMLVKVSITPATRREVVEIADIFRSKVVDVQADSLTIEATGSGDKLAAMLDLLKPYTIKETGRTGRIAMQRG